MDVIKNTLIILFLCVLISLAKPKDDDYISSQPSVAKQISTGHLLQPNRRLHFLVLLIQIINIFLPFNLWIEKGAIAIAINRLSSQRNFSKQTTLFDVTISKCLTTSLLMIRKKNVKCLLIWRHHQTIMLQIHYCFLRLPLVERRTLVLMLRILWRINMK